MTLCRENYPGRDLGRALLLRARLALAAADTQAAHSDLIEVQEQLGKATPPDPADFDEVKKLLRVAAYDCRLALNRPS